MLQFKKMQTFLFVYIILCGRGGQSLKNGRSLLPVKARLHGSPRLINAVESTKVNRVNSSFQRKWSTGLTGEQVGDGQLSFNVVDSLWVTPQITRLCLVPLCMVLLLIIMRKTVLETSLNDFYTYLDLHLTIQLTMCLMHLMHYVSLSTA